MVLKSSPNSFSGKNDCKTSVLATNPEKRWLPWNCREWCKESVPRWRRRIFFTGDDCNWQLDQREWKKDDCYLCTFVSLLSFTVLGRYFHPHNDWSNMNCVFWYNFTISQHRDRIARESSAGHGSNCVPSLSSKEPRRSRQSRTAFDTGRFIDYHRVPWFRPL